jgi:hypothetical protein
LRQIDGVDESEAGKGAGDDGEYEEDGEGESTGQLAAIPSDRLDLPPAGAGKWLQFGRLRCGGSQAIQASFAFLRRGLERMLQL